MATASNTIKKEKTMLDVAKNYLESRGAFNNEPPLIISKTSDTIIFKTVPDKMKMTIAASELVTFASQFRRNIQHWDGASVPINAISVILTGSGKNKDSSVRAVRKIFKDSYSMIDSARTKLAEEEAKRLAKEAGESAWQPFFDKETKPAPLFISPTTEAGLVSHVNDLGRYPIGAGLLYSGEFGNELAFSMDMIDNIKVLSELYDLGEKEVKHTKGKEFRTEQINGQPMNSLLVSSPQFILFEESVNKKFKLEFMTKLARRCNFCFVTEFLEEPTFETMEEYFEYKANIDTLSSQLQSELSSEFTAITAYQLDRVGTPLTVSTDVKNLFEAYFKYNEQLALHTLSPSSISALVRSHLQWKALKLAGAMAIICCSEEILPEHYIDAIKFCETLSQDMEAFEAELNKLHYERFADYMQTIVDPVTGKAAIDIHNLKKKNFIATTANPKQKLKELITPASMYDKLGMYSVSDDGLYIHYERIQRTEAIGVSVKPIDNSKLFEAIRLCKPKEQISDIKQSIAASAVYGYDYEEGTFEGLSELLKGNFSYSPFKFKDGVRGRANIEGGTKWVVLDIDSSVITAEEAHFMLSDINHHIALGSDKNNNFKFRVLLELDSVVDVTPIVWRNFYTEIASDLSLTVDPLPQSQIFYSYWEEGREVYSVTDASPIAVRDYLMRAHELSENSQSIVSKNFSTPQKKALLADKLTTFAPAFNALPGEGSRKLIWAANYAFRDLGATKEETIALVREINNYWLHPLDERRFENTIESQIQRW